MLMDLKEMKPFFTNGSMSDSLCLINMVNDVLRKIEIRHIKNKFYVK